ncbi:hypothetical protein ACZ91_69410 [Streptomyces regensis]|nr:hypothetical protein ACZ91_69410 [Streptomyces regensis]
MANNVATRIDLAVQGIRAETPVRRSKGAGPSDDGHLVVDGANATLPLNPDSPYTLRDGRVFEGTLDLGLSVEPVARPRFYELSTADGVPYEKIALLHGKDVLASTVGPHAGPGHGPGAPPVPERVISSAFGCGGAASGGVPAVAFGPGG